MIFSQSCPNYFPFLLSSLPLKLHFGHFPLFFFNIYPIFTFIACLPSPSALSFGYFPFLSSIYVQFSLPFHVFLLRAPCLLDIFLLFLQYMSNFHFHFMSSFSECPVFWIFSCFFFNDISNFPPFANHSASHYYQLLSNLDILLSEVLFMSNPSP